MATAKSGHKKPAAAKRARRTARRAGGKPAKARPAGQKNRKKSAKKPQGKPVKPRAKQAGKAKRPAAKPKRPAGVFTTGFERDPKTGWTVVVLRYEHPSDPARCLEARIVPAAGGNLYAWRVGDQDILLAPNDLSELASFRFGSPIMFPTPNRVRDGVAAFEDRRFFLTPNFGTNHIHGLVRQRPWQVGTASVSARAATVDVWIDWDESQPEFSWFPIRSRLTVSYELHANGVRIGYRVDNRDRTRLPFGFGLHPWFRVPGSRTDVRLRVPADTAMEAEPRPSLLPTGRLLPVKGTAGDLRQGAPLAALDLDDVYTGMKPTSDAGFEWLDRGVRVTLSGSREFTHMVVYTPPGETFFCMENQTCSTDAHNLHTRGLAKQAHLQVVNPGKSASGWVNWTVSLG